MKPGSSKFAGPQLNDEIRIKFLQEKLKNMEENLEQKMREHEIRLKMRIHSYGRACLDLI